MKVQELRELLRIADRALLEKAFVESCKQFSKYQKENIDVMISDIMSGKDLKKIKQKPMVSFDQLANRIIPKNQRPKWRFLVFH